MASSSGSLFTVLPATEYGYDQSEVNGFMAHARQAYDSGTGMELSEIRHASFTMTAGGYEPAQVDAALDRLEDAFAGAERDGFIERFGEDAWYDRLHERSEGLRLRMQRPERSRFREPTYASAAGYLKDDVDSLCQQLERYLDGENPMSVDDVRTITFASATGVNAYDESQVDAFLDKMTEIMASVG